MSYKIFFEIGHDAAIRSKRTLEGFTHDWEVYVRGFDKIDLSCFVDKVVFNLHETFQRPKRVVKEPPYSVKESGYAGFTLPIHIYFKTTEDTKKSSYMYELTLQQSGPPVSRKQQHSYTFHHPSEEFRNRLIRGGAILLSSPDLMINNSELYSKPRLSTAAAVTTTTTANNSSFVSSTDSSSSIPSAPIAPKRSKSALKDEPKLVDDMFNYFGSPITKKLKFDSVKQTKQKQKSTSNKNNINTPQLPPANSTSNDSKRKEQKTDQKLPDVNIQTIQPQKNDKKTNKNNGLSSKERKEDNSHKKSSSSNNNVKSDKKSTTASSKGSSNKKDRKEDKTVTSSNNQSNGPKNSSSSSKSSSLKDKSDRRDKTKRHRDTKSSSSVKRTQEDDQPPHSANLMSSSSSSSSSSNSSLTPNNSLEPDATFKQPPPPPQRPESYIHSPIYDSDTPSEDEEPQYSEKKFHKRQRRLSNESNDAMEVDTPTSSTSVSASEKKYSDEFVQKLKRMQHVINTTDNCDLLLRTVNLIAETNAYMLVGAHFRFDLMKLESHVLMELQKILAEFDL